VLVPVAAVVTLVGGTGDDDGSAGAPPKVLRGDAGPDMLVLQDLGADAGGAEALGGPGDDFVSAFPTSYASGPPTPVALLSGGSGDDSVTGYARVLIGGSGDDDIRTFELRQPLISTVRCGSGTDTLRMDRQLAGPLDSFGSDCEHVEVWIWSTAARDQVLGGTPYDDFIRTVSNAVGGGDDTIRSYAGDDRVQGDWGSDTAYLGKGDDFYSDVATHADSDVDTIRCGSGRDTVRAFRSDVVARDCEVVRYWE
jgi:Ca2+-binding RTX toxin-like protein